MHRSHATVDRACSEPTSHRSVPGGVRHGKVSRRAGAAVIVGSLLISPPGLAQSNDASGRQATAIVDAYPDMPSIPPIGVKTAKYFDVPASAQGPVVDPAKGYRLQDMGRGLYLITDNRIQSMFLVHDRGVVVMDAPQSFAASIRKGIAEVSGGVPSTAVP